MQSEGPENDVVYDQPGESDSVRAQRVVQDTTW